MISTNDTLFEEKQKFTQWWLWTLLLLLNGMFIYGLSVIYMADQNQMDSDTEKVAILIALILIPLLTLLFLTFRLDTIVKSDGIYFRFFPIHRKYRHYSWEQIDELFIRKYSPITEYGGWGIRYGLFGKGMAYNVKGNMGLQLVLKNDKRKLIGTNKPKELNAVIKQFGFGVEKF